ncbi:MAG: hypothetical protein II655_05580 [Thermoguttaceae bacterium]|nr:hypothetical protein [Thermoguttaceae bacterium]
MKRFPTDSITDGGASLNSAVPETAALKELDAAEDGALFDDGFELQTEEEAQEPVDPIEEEISAYLDGELTPEERGAFEAKIANQPELKARVEEVRLAWDALEALEADDPDLELTEKTVDRLNSETQTELKTLEAQETRKRRLFRTVGLAGAAAAFAIGYLLFSVLFPSVEKRRERDYRVVERLPLLVAIDDINYLYALEEANLFNRFRAPNAAPGAPNPAPFSGPAPDTAAAPETAPAEKTYQELKEDRSFYRRQERFESLDKPTQKKLRALYRQISESPNADRLWSTLDAYARWITFAVSDAEREELYASDIPARIETIRQRQDLFRRTQEFFARSQLNRGGENAADRNANERSNRPGQPAWPQFGNGLQQNQEQDEQSPVIVAFRLTLPEALRDEDLSRLYEKYAEYRRSKRLQPNGDSDVEGVFDFLANTPQKDLIALLSQDAQDYLGSKSDDERSTVLSALVSLSCLENDAKEHAANGRPNRNPRQQNGGNGRPFQGPFNNQNFGMRQPFPFGRFDMSNPQNVSLEDLANTLRSAPEGAKGYIASNPPQKAWSALLGLHWSVMQAQRRFDPNGWRGGPRPNGPLGSGPQAPNAQPQPFQNPGPQPAWGAPQPSPKQDSQNAPSKEDGEKAN